MNNTIDTIFMNNTIDTIFMDNTIDTIFMDRLKFSLLYKTIFYLLMKIVPIEFFMILLYFEIKSDIAL